MKYHLQLLANPQGWRYFTSRKSDPRFIEISQQIWQRDHWTCQFCNIQVKDGLEVVNLDHNYTRNEGSNLVTACILCAQCGFLESLGIGSYGGGSLIYLPELEQNYLNGLCHALFRAVVSKTDQQDAAQQQYRRLKLRTQVVEEKLGNGLSDPAVFGQLLIESNVNYKENAWASCLRLLPSRAAFKTQVEQWIAMDSAASS